MQYYKTKAAYNDGLASRLAGGPDAAGQVRGGRPARGAADQAGRDDAPARGSHGQAGRRLRRPGAGELTGEQLVAPFDLEVWFGDRVAVLGANGSGKSHFLRLLAAGGSEPDLEHEPVGEVVIEPVAHSGSARLGARVRPGWFAQTHAHPEWLGRTLLEILHRGDEHRDGLGREAAARVLDRYELAHAGEQVFEMLSGGQQARFQVLLLELSGATLLLLDEPTDNLDMASAEALEEGLDAFAGTVLAVTQTGGSPAASTGSWCSGPTAGSVRRTPRSGTRPAPRADRRRGRVGTRGHPACAAPRQRSPPGRVIHSGCCALERQQPAWITEGVRGGVTGGERDEWRRSGGVGGRSGGGSQVHSAGRSRARDGALAPPRRAGARSPRRSWPGARSPPARTTRHHGTPPPNRASVVPTARGARDPSRSATSP